LARNEKTGEQSYHKVSQTFATPNDEIYDLELTQQDGKSDVLGVTGNHPFWLKGKGWTESDLLKAGDLVAGKDETWLKVSKLTLRGDKQTGYNLEVEQDHTYFVGLAGAWVHNACGIVPPQWTLGAFKSQNKWANQMAKRGWTPTQITEAIEKGTAHTAENLINKGNPAIRYIHPETGRSVVIDNITKEVIHVGGDGFGY
jgi:hypothetical protein